MPAADPKSWTATGPADAPVIVFAHGTRLTRAAWNGQVRRLSGRFRCVALDLPGHGVLADRTYTPESAADHVAGVIADASPTGTAILVGASLGGFTAIETATRHPDRVSGIVLLGCTADPVGPTALVFRAFATFLERVPPPVLDAVNALFFRTVYGCEVAEPIIAAGFHSQGGAIAVRSLVGRRFSRQVFDLWTPILFLNGALDPVFGPGGEGWAMASRDGRHQVVRRAGHLADLDRPAVVAAAIRRFAHALTTGS